MFVYYLKYIPFDIVVVITFKDCKKEYYLYFVGPIKLVKALNSNNILWL